MSERDGESSGVLSSIEELLDLLGMGGKRSRDKPQPTNSTRRIREAVRGSIDLASGPPASTEVLRCEDGVLRLHVHGCGRRPVKLSRSRCRAVLSGWEHLAAFAVSGGRPGTRLTGHIAVREVNDVLVVEIGGEAGRPMRLTPEKLKKLLHAREAISAFAVG